jgi:hypothetical protein
MLGEKKLGVIYETKVSDLRLPRDDGVVGAEWSRGYWPASSEQNSFCLVSVDLKFPFGEIAK